MKQVRVNQTVVVDTRVYDRNETYNLDDALIERLGDSVSVIGEVEESMPSHSPYHREINDVPEAQAQVGIGTTERTANTQPAPDGEVSVSAATPETTDAEVSEAVREQREHHAKYEADQAKAAAERIEETNQMQANEETQRPEEKTDDEHRTEPKAEPQKAEDAPQHGKMMKGAPHKKAAR